MGGTHRVVMYFILVSVLVGAAPSLVAAAPPAGCLSKSLQELDQLAQTAVVRKGAGFRAPTAAEKLAATIPPIHLARTMIEVRGVQVSIPEVIYRPLPQGQSAQQMAEAFLSQKYGLPISLGEPIASGGMRKVFRHPLDPTKVIKVFDPTLGAKRLSDSTVALMIQREKTLQDYLLHIVSQFPIGTNPPFRLKRIVSTLEELERGIIIQEKSNGTSVKDMYPNGYKVGAQPQLDQAWSILKKHDGIWQTINRTQFESELSIKGLNGKRQVVGIDPGAKFSNSPIGNDGVPELIDW
ncbi:hypothetical protein WDW86_07860 [Bdellovibrionota bacterium FG-2]